MITVKFVGGARRSFLTEKLELKQDGITVEALLNKIQELKPSETPEFDRNNILIAINGADSSSLDGKNTVLVANDIVTIIPVIHGGISYLNFMIATTNIRIYEIKANTGIDVDFLDSIRKKHPKLKIQAVSKKFILNSSHMKKILESSLKYKKNELMLSNKLETDILMRFAVKEQINDAIKIAGIKPNQNFFLIVIGNMKSIKKLHQEIKNLKTDITFYSSSNIKKQFSISKSQLNSVYSKTPLEDLIVEKSSILLRNTSF